VLVQRYREVSAVGVILGIILVLMAVLGGLGWAKIFGAVLISLGGVGLGIWAGLERPKWTTWVPAPQTRGVLGSAVAIVLTLPLLLALGTALVGLGQGLGGLLGGLLCLVLGALSVVSLVICLRAIAGASRSTLPAEEEPPSLGQTT
jgi:hypothetical protein